MAAGFLAAGFLAAGFLAAGFLGVVAFLGLATFLGDLAFLVAGFLVFFGVDFLAAGFLAVAFLAAGFLAAVFFSPRRKLPAAPVPETNSHEVNKMFYCDKLIANTSCGLHILLMVKR